MSLINLFSGNKFNTELEKAKKTKGAMLLDVRTQEEYNQGHIPGSINIPLKKLEDTEFEKDTPIFVYCQSGARANRAADYLKNQGLQVTNLGGINSYKGEIEK